MAAWLSSTGISHHSLLPHIPSIHLSTVSSSPHLGIAPQSLNSSSWPLPLPGDPCSCPAYVWLQQGQSDSHSIYCHRSAVTFLALSVSPLDSDNCPAVGIRLLLQFPHPQRAVSILLTLFSPQFLCPTKFCMVLYILFHWSSTPISWCSRCTSVSEGVFLMYP